MCNFMLFLVSVDVSSVSRSASLEPQLIKSRIVTEESSSSITSGDSTSVLTRRSMRVLSREVSTIYRISLKW